MPGPPWLRCCCPRVSGHTHCLLVPARLAGVLEAGKLAVPAGPAVLVNDALLGGEEGAASSVTGRTADPCALEAHFIPVSAHGNGLQAGRAFTHPACPGRCPAGCRTRRTQWSLCTALPLTYPRREHGVSGPFFKAEQMDLIRRANELQAQAAAQEGLGSRPSRPQLTVRERAAEAVQWGGCSGPSWGSWSGVQGCLARSCHSVEGERVCLAPSPPAQVPFQGCQPCSAGERVKKGREGISPPRGPEEGGGHGRGRCGPASHPSPQEHGCFSSRPAVRLRPGDWQLPRERRAEEVKGLGSTTDNHSRCQPRGLRVPPPFMTPPPGSREGLLTPRCQAGN